MRKNHDIIEIACIIKYQTEKAVLINDGDKDVWLPLSKVDVSENEVSLPEWLALDKGLI